MKNHNKDAQIRQKRCMDNKINVKRNSTYKFNNKEARLTFSGTSFLSYCTQEVTFSDTSLPSPFSPFFPRWVRLLRPGWEHSEVGHPLQ